MNTDDSLSNDILPSGFGYGIGACVFAASSVLRSGLACDWVPNSEKPSVLHHMSKPPSATPMMVPNFDHSGLTLRTRGRSLPHAAAHRVMHALDARHVDETGRATDQRAARETQPRHRLIAALGDGARAIGK